MSSLLLDAHTLLWTIYEPELLSKRAVDSIGDTANTLCVSVATVWELVNKAAAHRLQIAGSSGQELVNRIEELGVTFVPVTCAYIVLASLLPNHHADPFDRLIIAQARANSLILVTKDSTIALYDVKVLWN